MLPDLSNAEPEATGEVLAACAGLPLAIRIAGARLAARGAWHRPLMGTHGGTRYLVAETIGIMGERGPLGLHLPERLTADGATVTCLDNFCEA
jgi:hypothetical protein